MTIDPITLEVLRHALCAVAEEMNANLVRSAYSPNIKERRDCSCAVFDASGGLVAQAESIPVHLGAMPFSVEESLRQSGDLAPGDVIVSNDPYAGGAHLPDLTFVAPVFAGQRLFGLVANRAHHADVGGKAPGSLAGDSTEIYQEGLRIPTVRLWRRGTLDQDLLGLILANVRTPAEREGDLRAQRAACVTGEARLGDLVRRYGPVLLGQAMTAVADYSERRMRAAILSLPEGSASYEDVLDGDGVDDRPIRIAVTVEKKGDVLRVDYTGSSLQVTGPVNAVYAVTASATYFAVRALTDPSIPPNAGCYRPIEIVAPQGTVVNASLPAPVVGGNLETAQRLVDVILGAFFQIVPERTIAACQGTMNNVALGGIDPRNGRPYTLYETIGGGFGGRPTCDGVDGVHSHMTNTLNTPVESLELAYPVRVERYELVAGTGGRGRFRGGLGIRRDLTVLGHAATVSLLTDRRKSHPYGLAGGQPGSCGQNVLIRNGQEFPLPAKGTFPVAAGETVSVRTPGGGGFGDPRDRDPSRVERDRREGRL